MKSFRTFAEAVKSQYKVLSHSDLTKRPDRVKTFLDKVKNKKPFMVAGGSFIIDPKQYKEISKDFTKRGNRFTVTGKLNNKNATLTYPSDFYKSPDLGGVPVGKSTAAENKELARFKKELQAAKEKDGVFVIELDIGGRTVECADIISTPQAGSRFAPKADFSIVDSTNNQVAWISHKAGRSAKDFQQYGGLSKKGTNGRLERNAEVGVFIDDLLNELADQDGALVSGDGFHRAVQSKEVINVSMYGYNFGKKRGINNVDEFHLGNMRLKGSRGKYRIDSLHKGINGDIPKGKFKATYYCRFYNRNDSLIHGRIISNSRIGVFPEGAVATSSEDI
tara:strand:+ start:171 stop:1175 length:1005 start_codon:yes stop_codon:yes gene_type:complete